MRAAHFAKRTATTRTPNHMNIACPKGIFNSFQTGIHQANARATATAITRSFVFVLFSPFGWCNEPLSGWWFIRKTQVPRLSQKELRYL